MVVSDVKREMTSPAATRGWGRGEQGHITMAGHCLAVSHAPCQGPDGAPHSTQPLAEGLEGDMEVGGVTLHRCGCEANQRSLNCCMHKGDEMHLKAQATPPGHQAQLQDRRSTLPWRAPRGHADGRWAWSVCWAAGCTSRAVNPAPSSSLNDARSSPGTDGTLCRVLAGQPGPGTARPAEHEAASERALGV